MTKDLDPTGEAAAHVPPMGSTLTPEPKRFFMSLRDISFWIHSARTDAAFEKLRDELGPQKAFDLLYTEKRDPFCSTQTRYRYQRLKYERLISFLPNRQYRNALDVGCGIGPFTRQLAPYAGQVLGVDLSGAAIEVARSHSASLPNVQFEQHDVLHIGKVRRHVAVHRAADGKPAGPRWAPDAGEPFLFRH